MHPRQEHYYWAGPHSPALLCALAHQVSSQKSRPPTTQLFSLHYILLVQLSRYLQDLLILTLLKPSILPAQIVTSVLTRMPSSCPDHLIFFFLMAQNCSVKPSIPKVSAKLQVISSALCTSVMVANFNPLFCCISVILSWSSRVLAWFRLSWHFHVLIPHLHTAFLS